MPFVITMMAVAVVIYETENKANIYTLEKEIGQVTKIHNPLIGQL
jgi:hypothetical protein